MILASLPVYSVAPTPAQVPISELFLNSAFRKTSGNLKAQTGVFDAKNKRANSKFSSLFSVFNDARVFRERQKQKGQGRSKGSN
jgi:hypothetical protein